MPPVGVDRVRERVHDGPVRRRRRDLGEVLRDRLPGDRQRVAVRAGRRRAAPSSRPARRRRGRGRSSTNRPAGRTSTRCGTCREIRSKSSSSSSTPASRAIASRCSTAFVDPRERHDDRDRVLESSLVKILAAGCLRASRFVDRRSPDSRANTSRRWSRLAGTPRPGATSRAPRPPPPSCSRCTCRRTSRRRGTRRARCSSRSVVAQRAVGVRADRLEHVLDRDVAALEGPGQDRCRRRGRPTAG